jgi:hypothetical protein
MAADNEPYRQIFYWRELLVRVAQELESKAGKESDPTWKRWLSARAMRIRRRLHEGVPDDFEIPVAGRPVKRP